jgi:LacI family transcriptional regulator
MPTIYDVAKAAGVSPKTVSRVLNDHPNLRPETRAKVHEAIELLGYRPNVMAQGLRAAKTNILGLITDDIATTPFAVDIIKGAQETAFANGKTLLVVDTNASSEAERDVFNMMVQWQIDGIIYATEYHRVLEPTVEFPNLPIVLVDCYTKDRGLPSVVPDEVQGAKLAVETLLCKGHERIGFINGPRHFPASHGRLEGYKLALAENNIEFGEDLICEGDWWQESGYQHTNTLMRLSNPPTALFCGNDWMAMGAYDALKEMNLSIPQDVAVIGFDNREVIAAHMRPPLTTIALPYYEMGQWAVNYLLRSDSDHNPNPVQELLACPLIERQSV